MLTQLILAVLTAYPSPISCHDPDWCKETLIRISKERRQIFKLTPRQGWISVAMGSGMEQRGFIGLQTKTSRIYVCLVVFFYLEIEDELEVVFRVLY